MNRLTDKDLFESNYDPWGLCGMDGVCTKGCHDEGGCTKGCHILKMYHKLAEYEDLEEQGKLLKLPCTLGDTVYEVSEGFIEPCTVDKIYLADYKDENGQHSYMAEIHYDRKDCPWVSNEIYFTDIGKTVFFTKTEAEAALEKMKG